MALISFRIGNCEFQHHFRIIDKSTIRPIIGQDFLRKTYSKIDLGKAKISFYKKPKVTEPEHKDLQGQSLSGLAFLALREEAEANIFVPKDVVIPARTHFVIPIKKMKRKHEKRTSSIYLDIYPLFFLQEKNNITISPARVWKHRQVLLVSNPNFHNIYLRKGTRIGTTSEEFADILYTEAKEPDPYSFRSRDEIEDRLEKTKQPFLNTSFNINPQLTTEQKQKIQNLLYEFRDIFCYSPTDVGCFRGYVHQIQVEPNAHFHKRSPPVPINVREQINEQLEALLKAGIIKQTINSEFSSPLLVISKPQTLERRIVINLQSLNQLTHYLAIPFTDVRDVIDTLKGKKWISVLDARHAYFHIKIAKQSQKYTAFEVPHLRKTFVFQRMPMGAATSSQGLSVAIQMILEPLSERTTAFADDLLSSACDFQLHLQDLRELFEQLRLRDLRLSPKKASLGYQSLDVLGFHISGDRISLSDKTSDRKSVV